LAITSALFTNTPILENGGGEGGRGGGKKGRRGKERKKRKGERKDSYSRIPIAEP
jgi:hypothetical protein